MKYTKRGTVLTVLEEELTLNEAMHSGMVYNVFESEETANLPGSLQFNRRTKPLPRTALRLHQNKQQEPFHRLSQRHRRS